MSFQTRGNGPAQAVPTIYTVYSEEYQGNVNHGFHQNHYQAPPPKYEDVVIGAGRQAEQLPPQPPQLPGGYERPEQGGVIFVAPVYKYTRAQRTLGSVFTVLFLVAFVTVLIKILSVQ